MLRPQPIMEDIHVDLAFETSEDRVFGDPGRLQQVFLNVLMNAGDALFEGRREASGEPDRAIRVETRSDGEWIEVAISDNGPGIAAEELPQVFDPFYTTKDPGKGTGLGLSVSHRIVEDMGGAIRVSSDPGRGTRVVIRLPLERDGGDAS